MKFPANLGLSSFTLVICHAVSPGIARPGSAGCSWAVCSHGCFFNAHTSPGADPSRISKRSPRPPSCSLSGQVITRGSFRHGFNTPESVFQMLTLVKHRDTTDVCFARATCLSSAVHVRFRNAQ